MAKFVDSKILQRRVLLFSKKYVPACKQVKEILQKFNLISQAFEVVEIESRQDVNQIENYFQIICLTDSREVPQLFIDRKYIGGHKEIMLLHRTGELEKMLQLIKFESEELEKFKIAQKENEEKEKMEMMAKCLDRDEENEDKIIPTPENSAVGNKQELFT